MDEKDKKILDILLYNSRLSNKEISRKTLIPITTIYNRRKRLEKTGIIKKYTLDLDLRKLGKMISAYILISVDYKELKLSKKTQERLGEEIRKSPYVKFVSLLAGETDLLVRVDVEDVDKLNNFVLNKLRTIPGVDKTVTMVVLKDI